VPLRTKAFWAPALFAAAAALAPAAAHAQRALIELCEEAGGGRDCPRVHAKAASRPSPVPWAKGIGTDACPDDWFQKRKGDCLTSVAAKDGQEGKAYVHPGGWLIDARCFSDQRFKPRDLLGALDAVQAKIDPAVGADRGGCLSKFNPEWGAELVAASWDKALYVDCPPYDAAESDGTCASQDSQGIRVTRGASGYRRETELAVLSLEDVAGCTGDGTTGFAGVLFHEFLHAAGADNYPTEKHNTAWKLQDHVFVSDRVYGAEALCFFGVDGAHSDLVHVMQCRQTVAYHARAPHYELCRGFGASFTDIPAKFIKH
jgi:hypothetical protein